MKRHMPSPMPMMGVFVLIGKNWEKEHYRIFIAATSHKILVHQSEPLLTSKQYHNNIVLDVTIPYPTTNNIYTVIDIRHRRRSPSYPHISSPPSIVLQF